MRINPFFFVNQSISRLPGTRLRSDKTLGCGFEGWKTSKRSAPLSEKPCLGRPTASSCLPSAQISRHQFTCTAPCFAHPRLRESLRSKSLRGRDFSTGLNSAQAYPSFQFWQTRGNPLAAMARYFWILIESVDLNGRPERVWWDGRHRPTTLSFFFSRVHCRA